MVTARIAERLRAALLLPGRLPALVLLAVLVTLRLVDPAPIEELRLRAFDLAQLLAPRTQHDDRVKVVTIDEESLAKLGQ